MHKNKVQGSRIVLPAIHKSTWLERLSWWKMSKIDQNSVRHSTPLPTLYHQIPINPFNLTFFGAHMQLLDGANSYWWLINAVNKFAYGYISYYIYNNPTLTASHLQKMKNNYHSHWSHPLILLTATFSGPSHLWFHLLHESWFLNI